MSSEYKTSPFWNLEVDNTHTRALLEEAKEEYVRLEQDKQSVREETEHLSELLDSDYVLFVQRPTMSLYLHSTDKSDSDDASVGGHERYKGDVALLVFHTPQRSVNLLDYSFLVDAPLMLDRINRLVDSQELAALVYLSAKPGYFITGADIALEYQLDTKQDLSMLLENLHGMSQAFVELGKRIPVVAAINGHALGGGMEVAVYASHRVVWSNPPGSLVLGFPEVKLGVFAALGGVSLVSKLVGVQEALKMMMTGGNLKPAKAKRIGLVDELLEADNEVAFVRAAVSYASARLNEGRHTWGGLRRKRSRLDEFLEDTEVGRKILFHASWRQLETSVRRLYPAPYMILTSVLNTYPMDLAEGFKTETEDAVFLFTSPHCKSLMSLFLNPDELKKSATRALTNQGKGKAKGKGKEKGSGADEIRKVMVVGTHGQTAGGLAQLLAFKDVEVHVQEANLETRKRTVQQVEDLFAYVVKKKLLSDKERKEKLNNFVVSTTDEAVSDMDLIVFNVPPEQGSFRDNFINSMVLSYERMARSGALIAINDPRGTLEDIAAQCERPGRVMGLQLFHPVHKVTYVEMAQTKGSNEADCARLAQFAISKLGKVPVVTQPGTGVLYHRVFLLFEVEMRRVMAQDPAWTMAALTQVWRKFGMDKRMEEVFVLEKDLEAIGALEVLHDAQEGGQMYNWRQEVVSRRVPRGEVIDRAMCLMINEATRALDEGVVDDAAAVDMESVFVLGLPPFTAGLLHYADNQGLDRVVARLHELREITGQEYFAPCEALVDMSESGARFFADHPYIPQETVIDVWKHIDMRSKPYHITNGDVFVLVVLLVVLLILGWVVVRLIMG